MHFAQRHFTKELMVMVGDLKYWFYFTHSLSVDFFNFFLLSLKVQSSVQNFFLLYITDLPKSIIQSFANIYVDDTTVYTSKTLDESYLCLWLVTFNASKTKLVTFHHH